MCLRLRGFLNLLILQFPAEAYLPHVRMLAPAHCRKLPQMLTQGHCATAPDTAKPISEGMRVR